MNKLVGAGLLWLAAGAMSMVAAQAPAPGGADNTPQQGEVQQTPGQKNAETANRPVAEPPMMGMSAEGHGGIQVNVVVTDKSGNPVPGLTQQEFTVLDNGQPRGIVSFHAHTSADHGAQPEVVIVLDTVNLGALGVAQARTQIDQYLRMNGGHLAAPTSVLIFEYDNVSGKMTPTTDGNALADGFDKLATHLRIGIFGAGAQLDQFTVSLNALGAILGKESSRSGRKLLIWVGPGWPLGEGGTKNMLNKTRTNDFVVITNLARMLRENQITMYSVSMLNTSPMQTDAWAFEYQNFVKGAKSAQDAQPADLNTKVVATESGGLVLGPNNDLARQIAQCVQDASAYYTITFDGAHSTKRDEYHAIQVQTDKPYLTVRTTTLYYAEP